MKSTLKKSISFVAAAILAAAMNSGCSQVGPDYVKPSEIELPGTWEQNLTKSDANITQWWKSFNDPTLDDLVQKTYEQNLDLRSAGLRIVQARAALGISEGLLYPQQQTFSGSLAGVQNSGQTFTSAGINFDVGWEMDVWGKYARGIQSAEATLYASVASYDDILVTIIAEVARDYINFRTAQERMAFAKRNIAIQRRVTKMTEVQFNAGNVSELDMQQAKTQLYTTESLLPGFELTMIKSRNAIAILLGTLPQEIDPLLYDKDELQRAYNYADDLFADDTLNSDLYKVESFIPVAAVDVNLSIDANLVRRRPDLQVAELQAKAQSARIGSAEAELYPHFSLFGSIGYNTNDAGDGWISAGDAIGISAGPAFRWNIFQYGRIKNQVRLQDALFQESLNNYNKKVLLAVQEVSNAVNGYRLTQKQLSLNAMAIDATVRAFNLSMTQYNNGLVTYQRLLSTVEKLTRNEDAYAQIRGNIGIQVISLYKALGGGWEIGRNKAYVSAEDREQMKARTDWGEYLDVNATMLPKADK